MKSTNRIVLYLVGVVALLLVALVFVVMNANKTPETAGTPTQPSAAASATSNPGVAPSTTGFDPKTATKVPAGTEPKKYVSDYYQAILDKKWDVAFKMQPAASQQGTVEDFQSTQTMYGMSAFKIVSSDVKGSEATVLVEQNLGKNGTWSASWTFVKEGADWLVKSRQVSMGAAK